MSSPLKSAVVPNVVDRVVASAAEHLVVALHDEDVVGLVGAFDRGVDQEE
jgi:hypothetical protein